jgi:hypothetical protein
MADPIFQGAADFDLELIDSRTLEGERCRCRARFRRPVTPNASADLVVAPSSGRWMPYG